MWLIAVITAGTRDPVIAYPDELLHDAVARMLERDIGRLPVVSREDPRKLVGYLGRSGAGARPPVRGGEPEGAGSALQRHFGVVA